MAKTKRLLSIFFICLKKGCIDTIKHDGIEHAGYLSFLAILSIFPFLVFLISLLGLFGETKLGVEFVNILYGNIPTEVTSALKPRIDEIISGPPQSLLTIAILGAIWTSSSTVEGLRTIFNRAYRVSTPPAYIWRRLTSILQFILITFLIISAMFIIVITPIIFTNFFAFNQLSYLYELLDKALKLRLIFSVIIIFSAISFIYYVIPNVKQNLINIFPGASIVTLLWSIIGSIFSFYLQNFDQVNLIYGSLASFIIALLFFYIIAMILIFGAEFNYALEKNTGFKFIEKIKQQET
ncbi:MAG: YihY/virulence factor BrkB family protein [Rickettsiales bacterium]